MHRQRRCHVGEFVADQPIRRRVEAHRHAGDQRVAGMPVVGHLQRAQRTGRGGQDQVVEGDAEVAGRLLDVGQRERRGREAATRCDDVVDERRRRREILGQIRIAPALLGLPAHPLHRPGGLVHQRRQPAQLTGVVPRRTLEQVGSCGRVGADRRERTADLRFLRLDRHRQLVGRRHPVGEHVVHLMDHGNFIARQPFCDIHLPQGTVAIQRGAGDLADQLVELTPPARGRNLRPADVVVDVDLGVLHPHRVMELQRNVDQLISQRSQRVQPRQCGTAEQFEAVALDVRHVEHADLEGVHVDLGGLAVEHHRVHAVEPSHAHPLFHRCN